MLTRWQSGLGLLIALGGAVAWSIGLADMQPLVEAVEPGQVLYAENNTYWARDFRWMAVLAAIAGIILSARGDRTTSIAAAIGGVGWLALDTGLDRYDVSGPHTRTPVIALACASVSIAWLLIQRRPLVPSRAPLVLAGFVAASLAPMAANIHNPFETHPEVLENSVLPLTALLAAAAVCCALSAAPALTAGRLALAAAFTPVAYDLIVDLDSMPAGHNAQRSYILGGLLAAAVIALSTSAPRSLRQLLLRAAACTASFVAYPVLAFLGFFLTIESANVLTELAGNPAVNGADWDSLLAMAGLLAGLTLGGVLLAAPHLLRAEAAYRRAAAADRARRFGDSSPQPG